MYYLGLIDLYSYKYMDDYMYLKLDNSVNLWGRLYIVLDGD